MTANNQLVMVSEWMINGNITGFLKANINADRLALVCFLVQFLSLFIIDNHTFMELRDITRGLVYMHNQDIIHGDLKGVRPKPPC